MAAGGATAVPDNAERKRRLGSLVSPALRRAFVGHPQHLSRRRYSPWRTSEEL